MHNLIYRVLCNVLLKNFGIGHHKAPIQVKDTHGLARLGENQVEKRTKEKPLM